MSTSQPTKHCAGCKALKPLDAFGRRPDSKDGRRNLCLECVKQRRRKHYVENAERIKAEVAEYRRRNAKKIRTYLKVNAKRRIASTSLWRDANPEKVKEHRRRYHQKHREKRRAASKAYYLSNRESFIRKVSEYRKRFPEKAKGCNRAWRLAHVELSREKARKWRRANPEKAREISAKKRARKRACEIGEARDVRAFYKLVTQARRIACHWCGKSVKKKDRCVDHIVPLARGGKHEILNLCCACSSCNSRKHTKLPSEFTGQHELFA